MACKDIIITIASYNPLDIYEIMVKRTDNVIYEQQAAPSYTQIATAQQVVFKSLPDGDYLAGIQRKCAAGGQSDLVWKEVIGSGCVYPQNTLVDTITPTTAKLKWTDEPSYTFLPFVDGKPYAQTSAGLLDMAALVAGNVYQAQVRKKCKLSENSPLRSVNFATTVAAPTFAVRVVRKKCRGEAFDGYQVRFSLTGGLAALTKIYRITFTEYDGTTHILGNYVVGVGDTIEKMTRRIAADFAGTNLIIGSDFGAFDITSIEQKVPSGSPVNCQDLNETSGYSVSIV